MKKPVLLLVSALWVFTISAQMQTVITGKVHNKPNKPLYFLVYNFDTTNMREIETTIKIDIADDSTFTCSTDKIVRPFTNCRIGFDNEGQKIQLSPGDTIHTEFSYRTMATTILFSGSAAGINSYLKNYQIDFSESRKSDIYLNISERDSGLITALTEWRNKKADLLNSFYSTSQIDSFFLIHESERIEYDFLNDLVNPDGLRIGTDQVYRNQVKGILPDRLISRDSALVDYEEYRDLALNSIRFSVAPDGKGKPRLPECLKQINTDYSGLTRTYCTYHCIKESLDGLKYSSGGRILIDYFISKSDDPLLVGLLQSIDVDNLIGPYRYTSHVTLAAGIYFLNIMIFLLLGVIVFSIRKFLLKNLKPLSPLEWLRGLIYLAGLILIISYYLGNVNPGNRTLPPLRIIVLILFAGIQIFYLIPVWFKKGRFLGYGLQMVAISIAYAAGLIYLGLSENRIYPRFHWLQHGSVQFVVNSWIILVLFSFVIYYLNLLIKRGENLKYLFKANLVKPEVIFNVFFLWWVLSVAIIGYIKNPDSWQNYYIYFLGTILFYFHAVFLMPEYLLKERFLKYIFGSLLGLIGCLFILYVKFEVEILMDIKNTGVLVPLYKILQLPDSSMVKTSIILHLLLIPAFVYAYLKNQVRQKSIGFKLFRNKEAELNQLRSQVNPHFLFNSLNTLYSFALKENNSKTAEYIAKLANLMRYLVDDMEKEKIPVQKEIKYIEDYINLQAIRSPVEHRIEIVNSISDEENIMIAPMLMIPFVENAFKHGINPNSLSELKVNFQISNDQFQFIIDNSVDRNFEAFYKEKGFGIGIENVRQRLEHIYPGQHSLSIADTSDRFIVILTIHLDLANNT